MQVARPPEMGDQLVERADCRGAPDQVVLNAALADPRVDRPGEQPVVVAGIDARSLRERGRPEAFARLPEKGPRRRTLLAAHLAERALHGALGSIPP